jgi:Tfp pilus assembly protein PilZ
MTMVDEATIRNRKHSRVPAAEPVRIYFQGDQRSVGGFLVNLGLGGAFVRCAIPVEVGRQLICAFFLTNGDDKQLVGCKGTVRWTADDEVRSSVGPGFGLRFEEQRLDTAATLRSWVERAQA